MVFWSCSECMQHSLRKELWFETPVWGMDAHSSKLFWLGCHSDSCEFSFWCLHPTLIVPLTKISCIILPVMGVCSYRILGVVDRLNLTPKIIVAQGKSLLFIVKAIWEEDVEGLSAFFSWVDLKMTAGPWDLSTLTPKMWLIVTHNAVVHAENDHLNTQDCSWSKREACITPIFLAKWILREERKRKCKMVVSKKKCLFETPWLKL